MWTAINLQIASTIITMMLSCFMLSTGLFYTPATYARRAWDIVTSLILIALTMATLISYNTSDVAAFLEKLIG